MAFESRQNGAGHSRKREGGPRTGGWGFLQGVFVYIKVERGRGQRAKDHVTAEKAADSNCDILFLWGRPSNLVIVFVSSLPLSGSVRVALTPPTIVELISV